MNILDDIKSSSLKQAKACKIEQFLDDYKISNDLCIKSFVNKWYHLGCPDEFIIEKEFNVFLKDIKLDLK